MLFTSSLKLKHQEGPMHFKEYPLGFLPAIGWAARDRVTPVDSNRHLQHKQPVKHLHSKFKSCKTYPNSYSHHKTVEEKSLLNHSYILEENDKVKIATNGVTFFPLTSNSCCIWTSEATVHCSIYFQCREPYALEHNVNEQMEGPTMTLQAPNPLLACLIIQ